MLCPTCEQFGLEEPALNIKPDGIGSVTKIFGAVFGPKFVTKIV